MIAPLSLSAILLSTATLVHGAEVTAGKPACTLEVAPTNPFFTENFIYTSALVGALKGTLFCLNGPGSPVKRALANTCARYTHDHTSSRMLPTMARPLLEMYGIDTSQLWHSRVQVWSAICKLQTFVDVQRLSGALIYRLEIGAVNNDFSAEQKAFIDMNKDQVLTLFQSHLGAIKDALGKVEDFFDKDFFLAKWSTETKPMTVDQIQQLYVDETKTWRTGLPRKDVLLQNFKTECKVDAVKQNELLEKILGDMKWDSAESISASDTALNEYKHHFIKAMEECFSALATADSEEDHKYGVALLYEKVLSAISMLQKHRGTIGFALLIVAILIVMCTVLIVYFR